MKRPPCWLALVACLTFLALGALVIAAAWVIALVAVAFGVT